MNVRQYGGAPFSVAVVHGGPGAGGEMAPVARELSGAFGVIEPIQTADTIDGQVNELVAVIDKLCAAPAALVGYSWGAWLVLITAARHPQLIKKLVLVGCGPFEEQYVRSLQETRMQRLSVNEREEFETLAVSLSDPSVAPAHDALARLGKLASKSDSYDLLGALSDEAAPIQVNPRLFRRVWEEAARLRATGELLQIARGVVCPVLAIHGEYDPHPAEGAEKPLSRVLPNLRFIRLKNCGHTPWLERHARDEFYQLLRNEL